MSLITNDSVAPVESLVSYGSGDSDSDSGNERKTIKHSPKKKVSSETTRLQGLVSYEIDKKVTTGSLDDVGVLDIDTISDDELPNVQGLAKVEMLLNASSNSERAVALSESIRRTCSVDEADVRLPPEPTGRCSKHLQDKITTYYKKRFNLNHIHKRKDFRNPSIYDKLISYLKIDEFGSNYPTEVFDAHAWDESSYYEALAKAQKEDMARREKERKERTKVEFKMGMVKKAVSVASTTTTSSAASTNQAAIFTTAVPLISSIPLSATSILDEPERKRKSKWGSVPPIEPLRPLLPLPPLPMMSILRPNMTGAGLLPNPPSLLNIMGNPGPLLANPATISLVSVGLLPIPVTSVLIPNAPQTIQLIPTGLKTLLPNPTTEN